MVVETTAVVGAALVADAPVSRAVAANKGAVAKPVAAASRPAAAAAVATPMGGSMLDASSNVVANLMCRFARAPDRAMAAARVDAEIAVNRLVAANAAVVASRRAALDADRVANHAAVIGAA